MNNKTKKIKLGKNLTIEHSTAMTILGIVTIVTAPAVAINAIGGILRNKTSVLLLMGAVAGLNYIDNPDNITVVDDEETLEEEELDSTTT